MLSKWRSIVRLFDALSHVIQPTYYRFGTISKARKVLTYLVGKSQTFNDLEECTSKPNTVMGCVHLCET